MTTPPKDAPVTEAGDWPFDDPAVRAFLDQLQRRHREYEEVLVQRAERAEAATAARSDEIDVETLAAELRFLESAISTGPQDWSQRWATVLAARLRSEQGERTPRVDSEIDAT